MRCFCLAFCVSLGLFFAGCGDSKTSTKTPTPSNAGKTKEDHGDHKDHGSAEVSANLAKLPAADRAAAEKQHHCPVSGELLGSMGVPIKVTVKDREVWLCCDGCKDKLMADPDKYLAKLK